MSTGQRREQLLAIGARLFAEQPYDDVWIEKVAETAGVSRGLLYHYFPGKREFAAEVVRAAHQRVLDLTAAEADPVPAPEDRLRAGLRAYVRHAGRFPDAFRVVHRVARGGTDPDLRAICEEFDGLQRDRICAGLAGLITVTDTTRLAVAAWLDFIAGLVLRSLDNPAVSEDDVCDIGLRTLIAAVGADPARIGQ